MYLFTFLVDIGRYSENNMKDVLNILISSLDFFVKKYTLIIFTNIELIIKNNKIIIRKYYDNCEKNYGNNKWLNLSFNKINIYKDLYDEFKINFTWIDLDTIIVNDISYLDDLSNFFIENGGSNETPNIIFNNDSTITVPRKNYIQGNMWKLNIELYNNLISCFKILKEKKLNLRYDLQDLFNYYIHVLNNKNNINIIGYNYKINTINGLCVWSNDGIGHATMSGLKNLYFENNILKSKYYSDKEVHILSFTFYTLIKLYNTDEFKNIFYMIN